jgi:hypothetical protein
MSKDGAPTRESSPCKIDLSQTVFDLPNENDIEGYKGSQIKNFDTQIREWLSYLKTRPDYTKRAAAGGIRNDEDAIARLTPEFDRKQKREIEAIESVMRDIMPDTKIILDEAAIVLSKYLPDWTAKGITVKMVPKGNYDYRVSGQNIYISLAHLGYEKDKRGSLRTGFAHEFFHIWITDSNTPQPSTYLENDPDIEEMRMFGIFKTINEGLAVHVSGGGEMLRQHHEMQGRNYDEYKKQSFEFFDKMLTEADRATLLAMRGPGQDNMGHLYVVGQHIVSELEKRLGLDEMKKYVVTAKTDIKVLIDKYDELNIEPKILNWRKIRARL